MNDLIGGQIEDVVDTIASLRSAVTAGRLKALAVTSASAGELLPGVHSVSEQGIRGYELTGWNVLCAPAGAPPEEIRAIRAEIAKVMARPETTHRLLQLGIESQTATGAELGRFAAAEREKWGGVIRSAHIRVD